MKLILLLMTVIISGCSSLNLTTDYDETINFTQLKTYAWHEANEHNESSNHYLKVNHIMDQRIRSLIAQEFKNKGLTKSSTTPDFFVNYTIVVEDRTDIQTYNNYNGYYPGFRYGTGFGTYGRHMSMSYSLGSNTQVTYYQQGTLIIDVINPKTDQLMWRGVADGRLPKNSNKQEQDQLIQKYITKILSSFPPKN